MVVFVHSPLESSKDRNSVEIGWGVYSVWEIMQAPENTLNICIVKFSVSILAPSCWNQQSCSSPSKRELKFIIITFVQLVSLHYKKLDQFSSVKRQAHYTLTSNACNSISRKLCRFSAFHILLFFLFMYVFPYVESCLIAKVK